MPSQGRMTAILASLVCAALLGGCSAQPQADTAAQSTSSVQADQAAPILAFTFEDVAADAPYVSAVFPGASVDGQRSTASRAVIDAALATINAYITSVTDEFGNNADWLMDTEQNSLGQLGELRLRALQRVAAPGMALITFEGYEYTGGAHGTPLLHTLAFDTTTGEAFQWSDGITATGLSLVAAEVRRQVSAITEIDTSDEWLTAGSLEPANVGLWWPSDEGLHLTYQPYALGPYAIGTPEVLIPWSLIEQHLVAGRPIRP